MAKATTTGFEALGDAIAGMLPHDVVPRCPRDGGRLLATVTVYVTVPVVLTVFPMGDVRRALPTDAIRETMGKIREQVETETALDERDELHCEKCSYWIDAVELEAGMQGHMGLASAG